MYVTVYHQTGRGRFSEFDSDSSVLEEAYRYEDEYLDDVNQFEVQNRLWRSNNAVDGSEFNVRAEARSLSVGDVVGLKRHRTDREDEFLAVASIGFEPVFEADVLIALGRES